MIFVTVGMQLPFDRLIRAVDSWCSQNQADGFAQIADPGQNGYIPKVLAWRNFLSPNELESRLGVADLVIAHAGMGSIISTLMAGKPIVIMPRRASLLEHRNDHQIATAEKFGARPGVYVAMDETELPGILASVLLGSGEGIQPLGAYAEPLLINTIREFILYGTVDETDS